MGSKKIHRFITKYKIKDKMIEINDRELVHQWRNVLKLKIGEEIILTDEDKEEVLAKIEVFQKDICSLSVIKKNENINEPQNKAHLYLAILKKENFELVVQKATELGINSITPFISEHTIKTGLNLERLNKIAKEASELSGRSTIPKINNIISFEDIFEFTKDKKIILFDISGKKFEKSKEKDLCIIIGPEGGFTEREIKIAKEKNVKISSISTLTLRGETAAIIATYMAIN